MLMSLLPPGRPEWPFSLSETFGNFWDAYEFLVRTRDFLKVDRYDFQKKPRNFRSQNCQKLPGSRCAFAVANPPEVITDDGRVRYRTVADVSSQASNRGASRRVRDTRPDAGVQPASIRPPHEGCRKRGGNLRNLRGRCRRYAPSRVSASRTARARSSRRSPWRYRVGAYVWRARKGRWVTSRTSPSAAGRARPLDPSAWSSPLTTRSAR